MTSLDVVQTIEAGNKLGVHALRCCMCPSGVGSDCTECSSGQPCGFNVSWRDRFGRVYAVKSEGLPDKLLIYTVKVLNCKTGEWHGTLWSCIYRQRDLAQIELNAHAIERGWSPYATTSAAK